MARACDHDTPVLSRSTLSVWTMFCPECKTEYRPGFTRCSDCDVDLVEELSPRNDGAKNELTDRSSATMKRVWSGKDEDRCVSLCQRLREARIPFKVDQRQRQYLLGVEKHYWIGVPPELFKEAREVIIKGHLGPRSQN